VYAAIQRVFVQVHKTLESSRQKDRPQAYKLGLISEGVELDFKRHFKKSNSTAGSNHKHIHRNQKF
jgi:hypothetical protein